MSPSPALSKPLDEAALPKWAMKGDMVTSIHHGTVVDNLLHKLWERDLEIAHLRGEQLGQLGRTTFQMPGPHRWRERLA